MKHLIQTLLAWRSLHRGDRSRSSPQSYDTEKLLKQIRGCGQQTQTAFLLIVNKDSFTTGRAEHIPMRSSCGGLINDSLGTIFG